MADSAGNVTLVWQSFRSGNGDIYARRLSGKSWGPETRVSTSDANDWETAVALDKRGVAWISWDSYDTGNYDVFLRSFDGKKLGETQVTLDGEGVQLTGEQIKHLHGQRRDAPQVTRSVRRTS